ncbi:MAG: hypothetical protein EXS25_10120 [Pedosphaera sp.]|nr:hypothetical protein [Pedosphaera sp.]
MLTHFKKNRENFIVGVLTVGLERMLRVYFLQQCYALADEALEAAGGILACSRWLNNPTPPNTQPKAPLQGCQTQYLKIHPSIQPKENQANCFKKPIDITPLKGTSKNRAF